MNQNIEIVQHLIKRYENGEKIPTTYAYAYVLEHTGDNLERFARVGCRKVIPQKVFIEFNEEKFLRYKEKMEDISKIIKNLPSEFLNVFSVNKRTNEPGKKIPFFDSSGYAAPLNLFFDKELLEDEFLIDFEAYKELCRKQQERIRSVIDKIEADARKINNLQDI